MDTLKYNGGTLSYTLVRRRGMKTIRAKISDDGGLVVSADVLVPIERIEAFLLSRMDWILSNTKKQSDKYEQLLSFSFCDGDLLSIFGKSYALKLVQGKDGFEESGEMLVVTTEDFQNEARIESLVFGFAAMRGRKVISRIYDEYCNTAGLKSELRPSLVLKSLKSKWGHNNRRKNEIMYNFSLCGLPLRLIEYVVAHEIAHCFVFNHSENFYELGRRIFLPDFKERDRELNAYSTDLRLTIKQEKEVKI